MCAASVAMCDPSGNRISCSICLTGALAGFYQPCVLDYERMPASVCARIRESVYPFVCICRSPVLACVCHSASSHFSPLTQHKSLMLYVYVCGEPNS